VNALSDRQENVWYMEDKIMHAWNRPNCVQLLLRH